MFAVDAGPWVRPGSMDASSYLEDVQYMLKRGDQTDKRGQRMNRISKWGYQLEQGWGGGAHAAVLRHNNQACTVHAEDK
jgi:hypothetical protein